MLERLASLERALAPWKLGLLAFALLCAARAGVLFDPPYWDSLMGAFPQGVWMAQHGLSPFQLLAEQDTYDAGGVNVYPFSLYPQAIALLYRSGIERELVFLVLHVFGMACGAATLAAFYAIARRRLPAPAGLLCCVAFATAPLFQSLCGTLNLDLPLTACTALSFAALDQRRFARSWAWTLAALLIKPTAVILIGANLVLCSLLALWPRASGLGSEVQLPAERRRAAWAALGMAVLLALFLTELWLQTSSAKGPVFVEVFGGWVPLFTRRLWVIPEYGLGILLFLVTLPLLLWRMRGGHARWIQVQCGLFLLVFFVFYGQYSNTLPRYFLQSYPFLLMYLALFLYGSEGHARVRATLVLLASLFHVVNLHGYFYPSRPSGWRAPGVTGEIAGNDGYLLERSLEYRDDLELSLKVAQSLERFDREHNVVVANWPLTHVLGVPEFGYVDRAWTISNPDRPLDYLEHQVRFDQLYDLSGPTPERRGTRDVLWVLVPNTFSTPQLSLQHQQDVLIDTVRSGTHYAFILRRRGWE